MKKILFILFLGIPFLSDAQYYQQFSQYLLNGLLINPGYCGSRDALSTAIMYRDQWVGFDGAPKTASFSAHAPLKNNNIALGLNLYNDKIGVSTHKGIYMNYAYRIKIRNGRLSLGLSTGLDLIRSHWNDVQTTEPGDAAFTGNISKYTVPNFGTGLYYYSKKIYAGFSIPFIVSWSEKLTYQLQDTAKNNARNYYLTGGYVFYLTKDIQLQPSMLYKAYSGNSSQLDLNLSLIIYDNLWMGLSYRTKDALVWLLQYNVTNQLRIGYAHDFTITQLGRYNHGSNEFMLLYDFNFKGNTSNPRFF